MIQPANRPALRFLNSNTLKLIAAVAMLIDHIGYILFPKLRILRIVGRLAFPIFAFMIAEGCHYTKNRLRYFLGIFLLGALCQVGMYLYLKQTTLNILLTFSCSILLIYSLQGLKNQRNFLSLLQFAALFALIYVLSRYVRFDYRFRGILVPVFAALCYPPRRQPVGQLQHLCITVCFAIGLILLTITSSRTQYYGLLTIPMLFFYSGQRGKRNFKYGFYLFYPLHLVVLHLIHHFLA